MNNNTTQQVHTLLKDFAERSLKDYDVEKLKKAYPFHRLFFDELALVAFKQERSVVTRMGMHLYPELAKVIALQSFKEVEREKPIRGKAKQSIATAIDRIVTELRTNQRSPNHSQEIEEIRRAARIQDALVEVRTTADIYIGDHTQGPYFAEIKSPLPNLDVCAEIRRRF